MPFWKLVKMIKLDEISYYFFAACTHHYVPDIRIIRFRGACTAAFSKTFFVKPVGL